MQSDLKLRYPPFNFKVLRIEAMPQNLFVQLAKVFYVFCASFTKTSIAYVYLTSTLSASGKALKVYNTSDFPD